MAKRAAGKTRTKSEGKKLPESGSKEPFYGEPGYLIRRIHQMAVSLFLEMTDTIGITPVQYAAMLAISASPGIDQRRIASLIAVDRTTMNDVTKRLAGRGWVMRERGRGRQIHLRVTAGGDELIKKTRLALRNHGNRLLKPLPTGERSNFLNALQLLVQANSKLSRTPVV